MSRIKEKIHDAKLKSAGSSGCDQPKREKKNGI